MARVYRYLSEDPRVVRPGSVRSFEAAVSDTIMRIVLEGGVDFERYKEIVTNIGIENLYLSVEVTNPDEKVRILREAFLNAFEEIEREVSSKEEQSGGGGTMGGSRSSGDLGNRNHNEGSLSYDYHGDLGERGGVSGHKGGTGSTGDRGDRGEGDVPKVDTVISTVYEVLYGGVGTVNFLNLAQLINMFVDPYVNIIEKLNVLRRIEQYLRSYGLLPTDPRKGKEGDRVFETLRNTVKPLGSGVDQFKVVRFTETDKYPTYVVSVREYRVGDNYYDIDLQRTAQNVSRKVMLNKPFTNRDIVIKEYANVKSIDLVLSLDVSGSMRELSNGSPKIEIAKDAISQYIDFLARTNDRLSLILFNFRADILWGLHLVRRYSRHMNHLLRYIYAGGGTNLANALEKSREVLMKSKNSSRHVIFVTDGRTVNAGMCIREASRLRRNGATISTIAIGENSDDELLMKLSKIGGGLFIKINSIQDLGRALIIDKLHGL